MGEFERLVKEMRDTQKEYFKTRDKEVLKKSKALEKRVDEWIQDLDPPEEKVKISDRFKTGNLF